MRSLFRTIVTVSFVLSASLVAQAADLPPAPPPQAPAQYVPVPMPVYNWGGIYVGINGGWGWGNNKWTIGPTVNLPAGASGNTSDNGGVIGGTLGFNYQMGQFVWGVEGDFDWSGINTGNTATICTVSGSCQTGNNWLSTLRGRIGFAADRVLFYGTGGGAFGNMQTTFNGTETTHTQVGWTAGLGAEYAFADNWTAKLEYLYVGLGKVSANCSTTACNLASPTGGSIPYNVNLTANLIRVGLNYKFSF